MNLDPWSQSTPQAGSKRPSPSPGDEDREPKKSRTQFNDCDLADLDCNNTRTVSQITGHNSSSITSQAYYNNETHLGFSVRVESTNASIDPTQRPSEFSQDLGANLWDSVQGLDDQFGLNSSLFSEVWHGNSQLNLYTSAASLPELPQDLQENPWSGVQYLDDQSGLNSSSFLGDWNVKVTTQPTVFAPASLPFDIMDYEYTTSPEIHTTLNEQLPPIPLVVSDGSTRRCIEEPTPALDASFKVDAHQDDLKKSSDTHSQADEQLPETSDASPLFEAEEFMGAGYEYDTCFGVIIEAATSSFMPESDFRSFPVHLKQYGTVIMLSDTITGAHAGILSKETLVDAIARLHLRLDAVLLIKEIKEASKKGKSKASKAKSEYAKPSLDYSIRIILHGLLEDKDKISEVLSKAGHFLQHPYSDEVKPGVPYHNPQYLLRPGAEFPLAVRAIDDIFSQSETDDNGSRQKQVLELFDSAEADGQTVTATNVVLSLRLRSQLMSHQITALAMMQEKESGFVENPKFPALWKKERQRDQGERVAYRHTVTRALETKPFPALGGIIADDMGLGKTLSMLALICSSLDSDCTAPVRNRAHRGTLIVAPLSTIHNWEIQARQHIHENKVRMAVYHGPNRGSLASQFADLDVVITTYEVLRSEWAASEATRPIYAEKWLRVVLDEGKLTSHHIRNRSSQNFQSVCKIDAQFRWCLTGTPIHNSLDDYGALLSFVRVYPFGTKTDFASWILHPVEKEHKLGIIRLRALIQATCLRRLKRHMPSSSNLDLPTRHEKTQEVYLLPEDQELYDSVKNVSTMTSAGISEYQDSGVLPKNQKNIALICLNLLRLICDHGSLISDEAKKAVLGDRGLPLRTNSARSSHTKCFNCGASLEKGISQTAICNSCAGLEEEPSGIKSDQQNFSNSRKRDSKRTEKAQYPYRPSAKIVALLENLKLSREAAADSGRVRKSVIFSCWVGMLNLVEQALRQEGYNFQRIDGRDNLERRGRALQEFSDNPKCAVMLASIGCVAEGVNLVAASIVHLMEPQWNPMIEAQAVDRVYRIGQTQEVTVIRYIVPGSVETHVQNVQGNKLENNENAGMAGGAER